MLAFESAEQLLAEPDARRYLHVVILNALRDKATRLEVRFGEDGGLLYYRVEDRDWELAPPPDEVYPLLKQTVREAARLVQPERPDVSVLVGTPGARYEPLEAGWLTYQLGGQWLDLFVRIDPRERSGSSASRYRRHGAAEFADAAGKPRRLRRPLTDKQTNHKGHRETQREAERRMKAVLLGVSLPCVLCVPLCEMPSHMTPDRDEALASLIDRLTVDARAGRAADIDSAARAHPDLATELRELWAVAQFAHLARKPAFDKQPTTTLPLPGPLTPSFTHDATTSNGAAALPREFGDFELLEELGRGGMGVVYKARQRSLGRVVALKMVREAHLATDADRARFKTEAESAARLKHPNIVTVHEVGTAGGQAYLCMEYVGGPTLRSASARAAHSAAEAALSPPSPARSNTRTRKEYCTAT